MIENSFFVNIDQVFSDEQDRTLEYLSSLYDNMDELVKVIKDVTKDQLNTEKINKKKILLKPNWVRHNIAPLDIISLCTHENFIKACLEVILPLKPLSITIGDAPIQGCNWDKLLSANFINSVQNYSNLHNIPIKIKDFRRVIFNPGLNDLMSEMNSLDDYIIFDLKERSYLEPITHKTKNTFRVTQYNPDRFTESHKPGMHKYCITKELFEADIIISLPKVKTHQKAGITAALKNIVGLNGDKDFLPHHRIGGTKMGGDAYPGKSLLRHWAELSYDHANRNKGNWQYKFFTRLGSLIWIFSFPDKTHQHGAAWYGNDTTWRMVMDLNLIIRFGLPDGTLSDNPQRILYSLCDGIIGGQGDGPLHPEPLPLGMVGFTNDSAWNDLSFAILMNMNIEKISLLSAAKLFSDKNNVVLKYNNNMVKLEDLKKFAVDAKMPPGWIEYA
ncbi:MAG: DUF362 domain-containing protein [Saprospiraceae bacterium]|nr:DUF362 domain-containing protein [Saprospiraceae bacterium]